MTHLYSSIIASSIVQVKPAIELVGYWTEIKAGLSFLISLFIVMHLEPIELNRRTVSEIAGSISIACWVVVFAPQIYENFRRKSSDGLSLMFIILWLIGDIFNIVGAIMQNLLPTMIILAAYYTVADIILWFQCIWYNKNNANKKPSLNRTNTTD